MILIRRDAVTRGDGQPSKLVSMHAIQVTEHGGPDVLSYVTVPQPTPAAGEVLIKADVIGINFIDTYFRSGLYARDLPFVVGTEVCGTVAAVGDNVAALNVGDRVVTASAAGAYAEFCTAPADFVAFVPDGVDSAAAAAVLLKGMTTHYLVKSVYPVQPRDTLLVHAGAGGVGLLLTQWATSLGAR
ncbi:Quinone oxidoreductase 1 [Mycobacterium talmoniae]|uniref:Quinone oxidoreductase 1 n=1 Tax=Mycobacterium talmoniae TaxID=1858794 RepID=A0A2S8BBJ7_9MYCO|nr:Quinone oxidoreductase 1 [Mycobacterium talmoniae]